MLLKNRLSRAHDRPVTRFERRLCLYESHSVILIVCEENCGTPVVDSAGYGQHVYISSVGTKSSK